MYIKRLTRLEQEMKEAKSLLKEVKMNYEKLPELPCCPIHEKMLVEKTLPESLDNCVVCTRNERDEQKKEIARLVAALTGIASAHKGWYANGKPMATPETQDEYILRIRNIAQCAVEGSPAARPI